MKSIDPSVTLMLPSQSPLDYTLSSHATTNGHLRRLPPPERRKKSVEPEKSWKFRVFNENTAVGFFVAFVLTFALLVSQIYFKSKFFFKSKVLLKQIFSNFSNALFSRKNC